MNLLALLTASGSSPTPVPKWNPLDVGGTVDDHMQYVFGWIFWTSVVIGVFVTGLLLYAFVKFRRRSDDEDPEQVHGSTKLEWTWTLTPYAILMVLFVISAVNMVYVQGTPDTPGNPTQASAATPAMQVTVIGEQFSWTYVYTDPGNAIASGPKAGQPVTVSTDLYVPANTPVELHIVSSDATFPTANGGRVPSGCSTNPDGTKPADQDLAGRIAKLKAAGVAQPLLLAEAISGQGCGVNHSFFIPSLAGQMNAIPGQVNYLWFDAQEGLYYGQCTELCGTGHGDMLIAVHSLNAHDWADWLSQKRHPS